MTEINEPHIIIYKRHMQQCKKNAFAALILQQLENSLVDEQFSLDSIPNIGEYFSRQDCLRGFEVLHEVGYIHYTGGSTGSSKPFQDESHKEKIIEDRQKALLQEPILKELQGVKDTSKRKEAKRVAYHLSRAEALALPATLTLNQWLATLKHFNWKCAYCPNGAYEVFEHFTPLFHGGGTTKNNCVPACYRCNSIKSDLHPLVVEKKMGKAVEKVRQYLQSCGSEVVQ